MARSAPNTSTSGVVATRVVYLPEQLTRREPVHYSPAQRAAKRQRDREAYMVWKERQLVLVEKERRFRHFAITLGAVVGVGLLAGGGLAVWWVKRSIENATFDVNGGVVLLVLVVLVAGAKLGHRCVTTIQHWH